MKFILVFIFIQTITIAQSTHPSNHGMIYRFELRNSMFPHALREEGHRYKEQHFSKGEHYSDSTALVFIPDYFEPEEAVDMVIYFHGWWNNVDTALSQFNLIEQFHESGRKAILVMPEGPKNAPDSFGGKLEDEGMFEKFIDEVAERLNRETGTNLFPGSISLAGHSGAYRVIAYILLRGGVTQKIEEVILFDGLYGDVEKYSYWLDNYNGRFINIYTTDGGTKRESENLMECLSAWNIPYKFVENDEFTRSDLQNRIVFIASELGHNDVVAAEKQFKRFLEAGNP